MKIKSQKDLDYYMKKVIDVFIPGIPSVLGGNRIKQWKQAIINETKDKEKIKEPCRMDVTFYFKPNQFPKDFPYGPDIDNHLKSFQDALNETIFSDVQGKDSCIQEVYARKKMRVKKTGARLRIWIYVNRKKQKN